MPGGLVPLIVGLVVIAVAAIVVTSIVRKIAGAAKSIAGTVSEAVELAKAVSSAGITKGDVLEQPPKSVAGQTSLLLPAITRDFPDFEYNEAKARAEAVLTSFLSAISSKDPDILTEGFDELRSKLENRIRELNNFDRSETYEQIKIHRTEINRYTKSAGRCIITFQTAIEFFRYVTEKDGRVSGGSREVKCQTKYNTDMIYVQDRDAGDGNYQAGMGVNCPNCGAPLKMLGAKTCAYCGTPVVELNIKSWNFSDVTEL